jgi:hypothetical protein
MNSLVGESLPASAAGAGHPAPLYRPGPMIIAAVMLAISISILAVGAWLTPSPTGMGSHTELGLYPCGFLAYTGLPCATCGMTTAVSHAAHGQILTSFYVQPAGALFALTLACAAILSVYSLASGVSLAPLSQALWRPKVIIALAIFVLAAWVYKIILVVGNH